MSLLGPDGAILGKPCNERLLSLPSLKSPICASIGTAVGSCLKCFGGSVLKGARGKDQGKEEMLTHLQRLASDMTTSNRLEDLPLRSL